MQNLDGTATCDKCGIALPGYGVLHGMVITDLNDDTGITQNLIVCYDCRPDVLDGLMVYDTDDTCNHCGVSIPTRSVGAGLLVTDLAPAVTPATARYLLFCKINGSRDLFLDRL